MIPFEVIYKPYPMLLFDAVLPILSELDPVNAAFTRQVNYTDPNGSVGLTISHWVPDEPTIGGFEPISGTYTFVIQAMTKNTNEEEGEIEHYRLADTIKRTIYRDITFRDSIKVLHVDDDFGEHTSRWGLTEQRFADNKINTEFVFLSSTVLYINTEIAC